MTEHIPTAHEVETYSGLYVNTERPDPGTINLQDIAHALSQTCRYGGHCRTFYSVAEHAVFVSRRLEAKGFPRWLQLAGLHHDDAEAYLGDIPRPMKPLLGKAYERLTNRMDTAIVDGLKLHEYDVRTPTFHFSEIKDADNFALFVEARHLLPSKGLHWFKGDQGADTWGLGNQPKRIVTPSYWCGGLPPIRAASMFTSRHRELTR
jgi:5'-deoxynucleotidase YfbR-like HD superfamily hydrolase